MHIGLTMGQLDLDRLITCDPNPSTPSITCQKFHPYPLHPSTVGGVGDTRK